MNFHFKKMNQLCHHNLSKDFKIWCLRYQKRLQQYTEEKNTFLRCEDLSAS